MVCFVILHYMVKDETEQCIKNLLSLKGDKRIVVVDNASTNDSGRQLKAEYNENEVIDVIINEENLGFAKGNNVGCAYAREKYNPDFYIVMNNDMEIKQDDFIDQIYRIYGECSFSVLGPDVYSTTLKVHQSPKSLERTTIDGAKLLYAQYEKKIDSRIIVPARCYLKKISILKKIYKYKEERKKRIDYTKKYTNVPLHGSCLIFSADYISKREHAFFDKTFFYYESEILDYECNINGFIEIYDPSIMVYHHQNVATNMIYTDELKKVRFMNNQNYKSIKSFLKEYAK